MANNSSNYTVQLSVVRLVTLKIVARDCLLIPLTIISLLYDNNDYFSAV